MEVRWDSVNWVSGHIPYICPGYTFDVRPRLGNTAFRTRKYKILEIVEDSPGVADGKSVLSDYSSFGSFHRSWHVGLPVT